MTRLTMLSALVLTLLATSGAQLIQLQQSHSTASLRGVHSLGHGVAWASGTGGTVLRTTDDGEHWQPCATPPGAEALDFRGVQAFDANRAVVMSSGKGALSRVYRTDDGCKSWRLLFTNPDAEGFWDAIQFSTPERGMLIGDPVGGSFVLFATGDGGRHWVRSSPNLYPAHADARGKADESLFAASNSSMLLRSRKPQVLYVTGGPVNRLFGVQMERPGAGAQLDPEKPETILIRSRTMLASGETAGGFSMAELADGSVLVLVGGDFRKPESREGVASVCRPHAEGLSVSYQCEAAAEPPAGYRSAVAYGEASRSWIAAGPTGVDLSIDGNHWHSLAASKGNEGTLRDWNAISLPFLVGAHGRIGRLRW